MVKLVATSVVRGSHQGESHGGVYLIDVENQSVDQRIDWNTANIDWQGRGWDRGLRGIAFDNGRVFIAASDEIFAYTPDFKLVGSWRCPYLKHCHEISVFGRTLFITSTAYDSIIGFDLDKLEFNWAITLVENNFKFKAIPYDPMGDKGPLALNKFHINNVHCNEHGMYLSGLQTQGMLHFNGREVNMAVELPAGIHNAQPFRDGVLFNDTAADVVRYSGRGEGVEDRALKVPEYDVATLDNADLESELARPGFARGLCVVSDTLVAGGSSPSNVSLYDLKNNERLLSVKLSNDVRNAIHGLEVWPYQ